MVRNIILQLIRQLPGPLARDSAGRDPDRAPIPTGPGPTARHAHLFAGGRASQKGVARYR